MTGAQRRLKFRISWCFAVHKPRLQCVMEHHVLSHPIHEQRSNVGKTVALDRLVTWGKSSSWKAPKCFLVLPDTASEVWRSRKPKTPQKTKNKVQRNGSQGERATEYQLSWPWEQSLTQLFEEALGLSALVLRSESLCLGSNLGSALHKLYDLYGCEYIHL